MSLLRFLIVMVLLGVASFSLAIPLDAWSAQLQRDRRSGSLFQMLLGDGRRLFANHFVAKADAYFHRGVYPSIFQTAQREREEEMHLVTAGREDSPSGIRAPGDQPHEGETEAEHAAHTSKAQAPRDWIESLNRRLSPTEHVHLSGGNEEREALPWLRLAAELEPDRVEAYTVTAYWLRRRLNRVDDAEQFLREGLRRNPGNPELLLDLGTLLEEDRHDRVRARNVYGLALSQWQRAEKAGSKPEPLLKEQIVVRLAILEEASGNLTKAIEYLEAAKELSPNPEAVQEHIAALKARLQRSP